jgi:TPR repeat protein
MNCLAFRHLHGRGVAKDAKKAAEWFRQAVKAKDISGEAKRMLKELGEE